MNGKDNDYALLVGLDWADETHDLACLSESSGGAPRSGLPWTSAIGLRWLLEPQELSLDLLEYSLRKLAISVRGLDMESQE